MVFVMLLGSVHLSVIDELTLKPGSSFPRFLRSVSYWSNLHIKSGVVHLFLYGSELYFEGSRASVHIGQRLTTLWVQVLQHERNGQHLQMQTETLLQVVDILGDDSRKSRYPFRVYQGFFMVAFIMIFTNLITSIGYHTFEEQAIGFGFYLAKAAVDYWEGSAFLNKEVGRPFTEPMGAFSGLLMVMALFAVNRYFLALPLLGNPTFLATILFVGAYIGDQFRKQHART